MPRAFDSCWDAPFRLHGGQGCAQWNPESFSYLSPPAKPPPGPPKSTTTSRVGTWSTPELKCTIRGHIPASWPRGRFPAHWVGTRWALKSSNPNHSMVLQCSASSRQALPSPIPSWRQRLSWGMVLQDPSLRALWILRTSHHLLKQHLWALLWEKQTAKSPEFGSFSSFLHLWVRIEAVSGGCKCGSGELTQK